MSISRFLSAAPPEPARPERAFLLIIAGLGLVSVLLHGAFLMHVARLSDDKQMPYFMGADTTTYLLTAENLRGEWPMNPMYRERVLLPVLVNMARRIGLEPESVLWLPILLEWPATMAIGYIGWALARRRRVGILAALLYVVHPDTYQNCVLLQTDLLHLQWVTLGVAMTVGFVAQRSGRFAAAAGVLWMLAQLTRPTYFPLILAFVVPWWAWRGDALLRRGFAALAVAALLVPAGFATANACRYGVPSPSLCLAEMLGTWTVPRARALIANAEQPAPMRGLFEDEVNKVRRTKNWRVLHGQTGRASEFKAAYRGAMATNVAFLASNLGITVQASIRELVNEIMTVPQFHHEISTPALNGTYPDFARWFGMLYKASLLFFLAALPLAFRGSQWPLFFFFAALAALVLGPASLSWWCCGRYRFNVHIIILPLIAMGLLHRSGWIALAGTFLLGYLPARLFGLPPGFIVLAAAVSLAAAWFLVVRRRSHEAPCNRPA